MAKYSVTNSRGILLFTTDDQDCDIVVESDGPSAVTIGEVSLTFSEDVTVEEVLVENFTDTIYVDLDIGDEVWQAVRDQGGTEDQADACRLAASAASIAVTVEIMVEDGDVDFEEAYMN